MRLKGTGIPIYKQNKQHNPELWGRLAFRYHPSNLFPSNIMLWLGVTVTKQTVLQIVCFADMRIVYSIT